MSDLIHIFIGTNRQCAENLMALEYSIHKNVSPPFKIHYMAPSLDSNSPWGGWDMRSWSTPFTGFRWLIPEVCGFEGRAIYQDDDQLVLHDLRELWTMKLNGKTCAMKLHLGVEPRPCVMLWDNARAKQFMIPIGRYKSNPNLNVNMVGRMKNTFFNPAISAWYDPKWNCFDGENLAIEDIGICHYTDMSTNPGIKKFLERKKGEQHWYNGEVRQHPRKDVEDLWFQYYDEAIAAGYNPVDFENKFDKMVYDIVDQTNYSARNGVEGHQ